MENCRVEDARQEICAGQSGCDYAKIYCGQEGTVKEAWNRSLFYAFPMATSRMLKILFGGLRGCKRQGLIFADLAIETAFVAALFPVFLLPHMKKRE